MLLDDPPSTSSSRAAFPSCLPHVQQCSPLRLQAQRDKLMRALAKAEGKAAHLQARRWGVLGRVTFGLLLGCWQYCACDPL